MDIFSNISPELVIRGVERLLKRCVHCSSSGLYQCLSLSVNTSVYVQGLLRPLPEDNASYEEGELREGEREMVKTEGGEEKMKRGGGEGLLGTRTSSTTMVIIFLFYASQR